MKTTNGLQKTVQDSQKGTEGGQTGTDKVTRLAKTHQDYWQTRLRKRSFLSRDGKTETEIPTWQVRLKHLGKESWFNLGTPNRAAAAIKARDIYLSLLSVGWQATLQNFKPGMQVAKDGCTVGKFLDQVKAVSGLKPVTYEIYAKKFRSLVAGVFKIHGGVAKHDYVNGGHKEWLDRVHSVRLNKLTPDRVNAWKVRELKAASRNPLSLSCPPADRSQTRVSRWHPRRQAARQPAAGTVQDTVAGPLRRFAPRRNRQAAMEANQMGTERHPR